jgi:hypothetical protein
LPNPPATTDTDLKAVHVPADQHRHAHRASKALVEFPLGSEHAPVELWE